ncbi:unnamed protein product [Ectocarpus sp. 13 AM-2016]
MGMRRGDGLLRTTPPVAAISLRRRRSWQQHVLSMQLNMLLYDDNESMECKRRSVTRGIFDEHEKEVSGWMKTFKSLDGPEMPFDEMCDMMDRGASMLRASKESREKNMRRYRHFDLRRNPELLTKTEEIELGRKVQELLRWERVRMFLELRLGRAATMEEWAAELATMDGVKGLEREIGIMKAARDRMISCNLRLVVHIAKRKFYKGSSGTLKVSLEDMIQDGTAGLVKAVERFDPEKGFRFSTYATWWVHQGIHCGFADCGRVVRLPMSLHTMVCKVMRLQTAMVDQLGRQPTVQELSLESGLDERKVSRCCGVTDSSTPCERVANFPGSAERQELLLPRIDFWTKKMENCLRAGVRSHRSFVLRECCVVYLSANHTDCKTSTFRHGRLFFRISSPSLLVFRHDGDPFVLLLCPVLVAAGLLLMLGCKHAHHKVRAIT